MDLNEFHALWALAFSLTVPPGLVVAGGYLAWSIERKTKERDPLTVALSAVLGCLLGVMASFIAAAFFYELILPNVEILAFGQAFKAEL